MQKSIQFKLTLAFTGLFTFVALVVGGISFYKNYQDANEQQDEMLMQLSNLVNANQPPSTFIPSPPPPHRNARIFVHYERHPLANLNAPPDFPTQMEDGFHTLKKEGKKYHKFNPKNKSAQPHPSAPPEAIFRTYVRNTPEGKIIITQENEYRESVALEHAWKSIVPLLILFPLVILLTIIIVRYAMKPVDNLSRKVEKRHGQDLTPLPTDKIPSEVKGFVLEINSLLARTDDFIQQQKRFIADASHELRSPMTALSLQIEQLSALNLPLEAQKQVAQVQQGIQRSRNLLEQLLSLARIQNQSPQSMEQFDLQTIFKQAIEDLLPLALKKSQDIGVVTSESILIEGNPTHFYLLIKTLLDNAIRYTPNGSQIDLAATKDDTNIQIVIEDDGEGIPEEERQRVLDPFYRILGTQQTGSGLGLAIANEIVQQYGGKLVLKQSQQFDSGLRIEITLPLPAYHSW